ncbi:hypothetical protein KFZ70_13345 [Tamlana fucoidanivorans]|uniref:Nicotinate-nucleotide adenylyltransferase n=1 Tax=Allotamlana fucoidanivorans TaxID=2583814 RepID=A0A5C4SQD6_9FLAO|nr:hypothetical protein [Tamlana fucoidanivorans]TNJ46414.1 hypothetical protein FGF67_01970 [Tamlana fucoidanivorans]
MKKLLIILFLFGFTGFVYSQIAFNHKPTKLDTRETFRTKPMAKSNVVNTNYHNAIILTTQSDRVKSLEQRVANYNITKQDIFKEKRNTYAINFKDPNYNGRINAYFNKEGQLIKSYELFKNVKLPHAIWNKIYNEYPESVIQKTVYRVHYSIVNGTSKQYKVTIIQNNEKKQVKLDGNGNFI